MGWALMIHRDLVGVTALAVEHTAPHCVEHTDFDDFTYTVCEYEPPEYENYLASAVSGFIATGITGLLLANLLYHGQRPGEAPFDRGW
jgi:hypothetical protein